MHIPNNFYRTSIKALILNEEKKFLLMLEKNGFWELPGGGLNFGETTDECLRRELREEAGLTITYIAKQPSYFLTGLNLKNQWKSIVVYETTVKDLAITPSDECIEVDFFTKEEALKEKLYPTVKSFVKIFDPLSS